MATKQARLQAPTRGAAAPRRDGGMQSTSRDEPIRIFISHQWDFCGQYQRLLVLLRRQPEFRFWDLSVPPQKGVDVRTNREVRKYLASRIAQSEIVLVIGNPSAEGSGWIETEIEISAQCQVPMIAVRNYSNRWIPDHIWQSSDAVVRWRGAEIAAKVLSILRPAR